MFASIIMWFLQIMNKGCDIRFILITLKIHESKKLWQYLELILLSVYAMLDPVLPGKSQGQRNLMGYSLLLLSRFSCVQLCATP